MSVTSRLTTIARLARRDCERPQVVAGLWCTVLGWEMVEEDDDGVSIAPADRCWPTMDFLPVPERDSDADLLVRLTGVTPVMWTALYWLVCGPFRERIQVVWLVRNAACRASQAPASDGVHIFHVFI